MRKGLGRNQTARRALNPIVTDSCGGIKGVSYFGAADLALIVGSVAPHSGEAVRLQLETDRQRPTLTGVTMRAGKGPRPPGKGATASALGGGFEHIAPNGGRPRTPCVCRFA